MRTVKFNLHFFGIMDMNEEEFAEEQSKLLEVEPEEEPEEDISIDDIIDDDADSGEENDASAEDDSDNGEGSETVEEEVQTPQQAQPETPNYGQYQDLINALENDQEFRNIVGDAIIQRRQQTLGQNVVQPKPDEDPEPEIGDDELLDDFDKRHEEWEQRQETKRFDSRIEEYIQRKQAEQAEYQLRERAMDYSKRAQEDPEKDAVISFYQKNPAPERLQALMQSDPDTFAYLYDGMRQLAGKGYYFANPQSPITNAGDAQASQTNNTPTNSGPRVVKNNRAVPFVEGGGGNIHRGGEGAPQFKDMSTDEFNKIVERVKMHEFR